MISTVVFDMGNVLVHSCHRRMCRQIAALCRTSDEDVTEFLMKSGLQWNFERGLISPEQLHQEVESQLKISLKAQDLFWAASDIFELNSSIVPVLHDLKRQGKRLVLLSNTSQWHFEFIREQFSVLASFDEYVLSYEVGAIKPDALIYERLLARLACRPYEAFYTDDIPAYVAAGRRHGMNAEVFIDVPKLIADLARYGVTVQPSAKVQSSDPLSARS